MRPVQDSGQSPAGMPPVTWTLHGRQESRRVLVGFGSLARLCAAGAKLALGATESPRPQPGTRRLHNRRRRVLGLVRHHRGHRSARHWSGGAGRQLARWHDGVRHCNLGPRASRRGRWCRRRFGWLRHRADGRGPRPGRRMGRETVAIASQIEAWMSSSLPQGRPVWASSRSSNESAPTEDCTEEPIASRPGCDLVPPGRPRVTPVLGPPPARPDRPRWSLAGSSRGTAASTSSSRRAGSWMPAAGRSGSPWHR